MIENRYCKGCEEGTIHTILERMTCSVCGRTSEIESP